MKQYFAVKISQSILSYEVLINIDETTFSRDTKITHSWLPKGRDSELMNILYSNSTSLITSITSLGEVFAISTVGAVNSSMFIEFLSKLKLFVERKGSTYIENCLIILDNASTHRSQQSIQYLQSNGFNDAYIPVYTPEFSPIEKYFSRLKHIVMKRSKAKILNWQSDEAQNLIVDAIQIISKADTKKLWSVFAKEIRYSIENLRETI